MFLLCSSGTDVLNGLRQICKESKDIISDPPPSWIRKAVYRGRHQVCIKPRKKFADKKSLKDNRKSRIVVEDFHDSDEEMSIFGSDITVVNRN